MEEYSVKIILQHKYCSKQMIEEYFPKNAEIVNRQFLWECWLTYDYENADKYFHAVQKSKLKPSLPKKFKMVFDEKWLDLLLEHDCKSKLQCYLILMTLHIESKASKCSILMEQKEKPPKEGKKRDYSKFMALVSKEPYLPKKERKLNEMRHFELKQTMN